MSAIKAAILAALPDPADVQLNTEAARIAELLHETQSRLAAERGQLAAVTPWGRLPHAVRLTRVDAVTELLLLGHIAGSEPRPRGPEMR